MDRYSKFILTIIAISLSVIAVQLVRLLGHSSDLFHHNSTMGDMREIQKIPESKERQEAVEKFLNEIPIVHVRDGNITIDNGR